MDKQTAYGHTRPANQVSRSETKKGGRCNCPLSCTPIHIMYFFVYYKSFFRKHSILVINLVHAVKVCCKIIMNQTNIEELGQTLCDIELNGCDCEGFNFLRIAQHDSFYFLLFTFSDLMNI